MKQSGLWRNRAFLKKRLEGYREGRWVVVDFGDVLVHIFHREEREFYDIERLWRMKEITSIILVNSLLKTEIYKKHRLRRCFF